jgi:hypothetical protein
MAPAGQSIRLLLATHNRPMAMSVPTESPAAGQSAWRTPDGWFNVTCWAIRVRHYAARIVRSRAATQPVSRKGKLPGWVKGLVRCSSRQFLGAAPGLSVGATQSHYPFGSEPLAKQCLASAKSATNVYTEYPDRRRDGKRKSCPR